MKDILILLSGFLPLCLFGQGNADIWLLRIDLAGEKINLTQPENITARIGYDNQPVFSQDSKKIYFTSQPEGLNQTDIYSYDIIKKEITQFNFSKTSEFSPAFIPGARGLSVVMVEEDSTQRIWEFDLSGKRSRLIFPHNDSVGYYSWVNVNTVVAFILGNNKGRPSRFSLLHRDGREKLIAENIVRGMKAMDKGAFFLKMEEGETFLHYTDFTDSKKIIKVPGKSIDMAILKNHLLMTYQGIIYAAKMEMKGNVFINLSEFLPVADLSGYGLKNMSRMAVSADGKWLAVVNTE